MKTILKSFLGRKEEDYLELFKSFIEQIDFYKSKKIILIEDLQLSHLKFLLTTHANCGQFPTEMVFVGNFPQYDGFLDHEIPLDIEDLYVYVRSWLFTEVNKAISVLVSELTPRISIEGLNEEVMTKIEELRSLTVTHVDEIQIRLNHKEIYDERVTKTIGLTTGIDQIDQYLGGLGEGTVTTIAGFTSHFKTTFAINVAYRNAYHFGYNIVYLSLETPKEYVLDYILCRHSNDSKFTKFPFICHEKMRNGELTPEEDDYLHNVIEPDLYADYIDEEGNTRKRGQVVILDESDFDSMSFSDITAVFEKLDDDLEGGLDAFVLDYAQLCKFTENSRETSDNKIINSYITFFRRMTQRFRYGSKKKKLIGIILSQINRTNWLKAVKKEGRYDLTCLADANELERGSFRVLTSYTTEEMKGLKEAQVQILKNRGGRTMWEPYKLFVDGESYVYGDEMESFGSTMGGADRDSTNLVDAMAQAGSFAEDLF